MSTAPLAVPRPPASTRRGLFEAMLLRLLGVIGFMCVPTAISLLYANGRTVEAIRFLSVYSPEKFVHGRVWTLVGSAFLLPRLAMVGPTSMFIVAIFLPFALARGARQAAKVFIVGHCFSTFLVGVVVTVGAAAGWHAAHVIYLAHDVGASAGLAACAGALSCVIFRRSRPLGAVLLVSVLAFFLDGLIWGRGGGHGVTDVEHLLAVVAGVFVQVRWP